MAEATIDDGALSGALWIGGPPGAGKTTVATRLARRHGVRWYCADTRTWAHRDRALAAGHDAAARWEALTPEERRATDRTDDELLAMSLHRERGAMVVDDVRALPPHPITLVEGSVVAAALVPDLERAVWLLPTEELHQARLRERGDANRLYRLLVTVIAAEARAHGVPVLDVDGSLTIDEAVEAVERLLGEALAAGPRAETAGERRALLREANLATVAQVRAYFARPWARGDGERAERSFICECGDTSCVADVVASVAAVAAAPAVATGHHIQ